MAIPVSLETETAPLVIPALPGTRTGHSAGSAHTPFRSCNPHPNALSRSFGTLPLFPVVPNVETLGFSQLSLPRS